MKKSIAIVAVLLCFTVGLQAQMKWKSTSVSSRSSNGITFPLHQAALLMHDTLYLNDDDTAIKAIKFGGNTYLIVRPTQPPKPKPYIDISGVYGSVQTMGGDTSWFQWGRNKIPVDINYFIKPN